MSTHTLLVGLTRCGENWCMGSTIPKRSQAAAMLDLCIP
jgi:hypothetical protein